MLVYDGTGVPDVRTTTVSGLISDMTYAFKVAPINSLGEGILSDASNTVVTTSGAAATYTTASGSSLSTGITYKVDEVQTIKAVGTACGPGAAAGQQYNVTNMQNMKSTLFDTTKNEATLASLFETALNFANVTVQYMDNSTAGANTYMWRVTFHDEGDVPSLDVSHPNANCDVQVLEFLKGNKNHFTIEPRKASGAVVRDVTTAAGFAGQDVFLTETYHANGTWYRDQGVAAYNQMIYTVQRIDIGGTTTGVALKLSDYMTPDSTSEYTATSNIAYNSAASAVQTAIESLTNVDSVDVQKLSV
jgi:hypothetical protein